MVKIMENPMKMDDLVGKTHYFRKHPHRGHGHVRVLNVALTLEKVEA